MKWVENTRAEAQRMAGLVADLLFLAKNDDGLKVQMEDVNLSDCVGTIVLGYDAIFTKTKRTLPIVDKDVYIVGNVGQLKQLTTILLDNANKYSKGSGNITLSLTANGKHAHLTVENDSEQLTEEQLKHLFDRFYTVDPSRNKNNGGNGPGTQHSAGNLSDARRFHTCRMRKRTHTFCCDIPRQKPRKEQ